MALRTDEWGRVILDDQALLEFFYNGLDETNELYVDPGPSVAEYNKWCRVYDKPRLQLTEAVPLDVSPVDYHNQRQATWLMPDAFASLDIGAFILNKCTTPIEIERVQDELKLFTSHNMLDVLRLFAYMVETMRENQVLWGVGRGSSVASYCLYLLGVHSVNSIKYNLDIKEFLRD